MANIVDKRTLDEWKLFCEQVQNSTAANIYEPKEVQDARKKRALKNYNYFVKEYMTIYSDCDCADFQIQAAVRICIKERPTSDPNLIAILEWPREHAKSVHADVIIPMWLLAQGKLNGMILMGKNEADACNLLGDIQAQLQYNALFIRDFGEQYNFGDWQEGDFTTKSGIRFFAVGRDQSPRGARKGQRRPNYAVVDDIDDDELVLNQSRVRKIVERILGALFFALDTRGATLVIAGNRIHAQSVLAHMVGDTKPGAPKREGIYHSKIFAIDPKTGQPAWHQRYSKELIESKVRTAGVIGRKEFFHENHIEGSIFKDSLFHWKKPNNLATYKIIVGYFDPSFENKATSDYKAIRVWGGFENPSKTWEKHCLKSFVRQCELQKAFEFMSNYEDTLPGGVGVIWYVEKQFFNRPVQDALHNHNTKREQQGKRRLVVITDTRKKEAKYLRMVKMEPSYTDGEVYYNINEMYNPDMIEGNNQLKGIEPGYQGPDDSPDADEGAWFYLDQHKPGRDFKPIIRAPQRKGW